MNSVSKGFRSSGWVLPLRQSDSFGCRYASATAPRPLPSTGEIGGEFVTMKLPAGIQAPPSSYRTQVTLRNARMTHSLAVLTQRCELCPEVTARPNPPIVAILTGCGYSMCCANAVGRMTAP